MLHYLRHRPKYLTQAAKFVKFAQLDSLTNTVVFSLYGNLFHEGEEKLLLNFISVIFNQ